MSSSHRVVHRYTNSYRKSMMGL